MFRNSLIVNYFNYTDYRDECEKETNNTIQDAALFAERREWRRCCGTPQSILEPLAPRLTPPGLHWGSITASPQLFRARTIRDCVSRPLPREIRFLGTTSSLDALSWWSLHGHAPRYCVSNQLFSRVNCCNSKGHVLIEADKVNYLLLILAGPHTRNLSQCMFALQYSTLVHVSAKYQIKRNRPTIFTFRIFH